MYLRVFSPQNTIHQWNIFFYISATIFFVGGLMFALFAEGEPLTFDETPKTVSGDIESTKSSMSGNGKSNIDSITKILDHQESYDTPPTGNSPIGDENIQNSTYGNIQSSPSHVVFDEEEAQGSRSEVGDTKETRNLEA